MSMMSDFLSNYLDDLVPVFFEDILVHYHTVVEHSEHVGKGLDILCQHRFFTKMSKRIIVRDMSLLDSGLPQEWLVL